MPSIAGRAVLDARRGLVFWTVGIVALVVLTVSIYPSISGNEDFEQALESYPEALKAFVGGELDLTTGPGYLRGELFSFMVPLLLLIYGIGAGARAIAGEEEAGTLDLLLSHPLTRQRVLLEKLGAAAVLLGALGAVVFVSVWLSSLAFGLEVPAGNVAAAVLGAVLLALFFSALALLVGAATGSRSLAVALPSAVAVAAYLLDGLANLVDALEPLRAATPWDWYAGGNPLREGLDVTGAGLLLAGTALAVAAALPLFARRDLSA
jgi:ABC-2 type transport system permease protein